MPVCGVLLLLALSFDTFIGKLLCREMGPLDKVAYLPLRLAIGQARRRARASLFTLIPERRYQLSR